MKEVLKAVLSDREYESMKSIINYLENNSSITTGVAMKLSGKSSTTAWRYLKKLESLNILKGEGSTNQAEFLKII